MSSGFERNFRQNAPPGVVKPHATPPAVSSTLTQAEAKVSGYTGSVCDHCGSTRMKMAGHCMVCEECGSTTGCS